MVRGGQRRGRRVWRWVRRLVVYPVLALVLLIGGATAWVQASMYRAPDPDLSPLVLTGVTALVGPELEPVPDATVLVRDGRVEQVGPAAEVTVPEGARVLDLAGATVLPGLIDSHAHLGAPTGQNAVSGIASWANHYFRYAAARREAYLQHGVTSVRSMGDDPQWVLELRQRVADGELAGPRVFAAGPVFTTPNGHPVVTLGGSTEDPGIRAPATPAEARAAVRELATGERPVDLVKVIQERGDPARLAMDPIPMPVLEAIVDEAHAHDLPVVAHWGTQEDLADVLAAGVDGLDHLEPRGTADGWDPDLLAQVVSHEVTLAPTFAVMEPKMRDTGLATQQERFAEFLAAGGRGVAGSDAPLNGLEFGAALIRELELLVEAGATPQQALQAATSAAAEVLRTDEVGVLAQGRPADLLVVDGDPLTDITALREVLLVLRDGTPVVDHLP